MSISTTETLQRLFAQFSRELVAGLPADQREAYQQALTKRAEELLRSDSGGDGTGSPFADLVGLGENVAFDNLGTPRVEADFDDAVIASQLHAAAELYYIYQHERMKVFDVVGVLLRLFHEGRMRIQRGPGARALYLIEKHHPLRYKRADRLLAYRRAFNYDTAAPRAGAVVNRNFHRQFVAFNAAVAQYFRDLLIGEVIRGSHNIEQRPFGSQATIQRLGIDLRWQMDRATYGNIIALQVETTAYLKTVMDAFEMPDIKKAFDANNKWDVIEIVSERHLGSAYEIAQRSKLADAGRQLLLFAANNPFNGTDFQLFQTEMGQIGPISEQWIAAYRMTQEGRAFPGVAPALRSILGVQSAPGRAA